VDAKDKDGHTALLWACGHNQIAAARELVALGADVLNSSSRCTTLHLAAFKG
jgi:ankyrin repeat protein